MTIIVFYFLFCSLVGFVIFLKLYIKLTTGWCKSQVCLLGKTAMVTGANSGIGRETAKDFAKRGAKVIITCITEELAKETCEKLRKETNNENIFGKAVDYSSLKAVRQLAEEIKNEEDRLDILVNNAAALDFGELKSEDGLQLLMQVNYFAPFLLTNLLLDLIKKSAPSRIVNVASIAGKYSPQIVLTDLNGYPGDAMRLYSKSKLCVILFSAELASRLKGTGVTVYSLHPGVSLTNITQNMAPFFKLASELLFPFLCKSNLEAAQTSIYCAIQKGIEEYSGEHFHDCHWVKGYKQANAHRQLQKKLWDITEEIVRSK